jgi:hypothetical protein
MKKELILFGGRILDSVADKICFDSNKKRQKDTGVTCGSYRPPGLGRRSPAKAKNFLRG